MAYLAFVFILSLAIFAFLFALSKSMGAANWPTRFVITCVFPIVSFCLVGILAMTVFMPEYPADMKPGEYQDYPDPGPVSFLNAVQFGFFPATIYTLISIPLHLFLSRRGAQHRENTVGPRTFE